MCREVFGDKERSYSKPVNRLSGHLEGYDPSKSPKFVWPERLLKTKQEILSQVKEQGDDRRQQYDK